MAAVGHIETRRTLVKLTYGDIPEFLQFEEYVVHTKVVNDTAERAIKLWSDYLNILTTDEMKREGLVQVVEDHRKRVKGRNKSVAWEGIKF